MQHEGNKTTASGRQVRKAGMDDKKMSAIDKMRAMRSGKMNRNEMFQQDEDEMGDNGAVFEEIDDEEYEKK